MQTQEIKRSEWQGFFNIFSRQHEGWLATLEILGPDMGAQEEGHELALEGVSLSSGADENESISIDLGRSADEYVSHSIPEPARVWVEQTDEGANAALEIEAKDGTRALLRFRSAVRPELVDGVVQDR